MGGTERRVPPMARSRLRRVAHRRNDQAFLDEAWKRARVLVVDRGQALVRGDRLVLVDAAGAPEGQRVFLGEDEAETPYFAVFAPIPDAEATLDGIGRATVREVGDRLDDLEVALLTTAVALENWHRRHEYSPRHGAPTEVLEGGWARASEGGRMMWPRTDPAVIVLVHDGVPGPEGHCLLGHNAAWTSVPSWRLRYSCLAGFVEAGESAEAAALREVAEEVGVTLSRLHYLGSQAWPYPGSLMLGFTAVADRAEPVRVDETEIASARWFGRTEIAAVLSGERDDFGLPMPSSIALFLIKEWLAGRP